MATKKNTQTTTATTVVEEINPTTAIEDLVDPFEDLGELEDTPVTPVQPVPVAEAPKKSADNKTNVRKVECVVSNEVLETIKKKTKFTLDSAIAEKFSFAKDVKVSRSQEHAANTVVVTLYLNEHDVDRAGITETWNKIPRAAFEAIFGKIEAIMFDGLYGMEQGIDCNIQYEFYSRSEHFGKIVAPIVLPKSLLGGAKA